MPRRGASASSSAVAGGGNSVMEYTEYKLERFDTVPWTKDLPYSVWAQTFLLRMTINDLDHFFTDPIFNKDADPTDSEYRGQFLAATLLNSAILHDGRYHQVQFISPTNCFLRWKTLRDHFFEGTDNNKQLQLRTLRNMLIKPNEDFTSFLHDRWNVQKNVVFNLGFQMDDATQIADLVQAMTGNSAYAGVEQHLIFNSGLNYENVIILYKNLERKILENKDRSVVQQAMAARIISDFKKSANYTGQQKRADNKLKKGVTVSGSIPDRDMECFNCGKKGHRKSNCRAVGGGAHKGGSQQQADAKPSAGKSKGGRGRQRQANSV